MCKTTSSASRLIYKYYYADCLNAKRTSITINFVRWSFCISLQHQLPNQFFRAKFTWRGPKGNPHKDLQGRNIYTPQFHISLTFTWILACPTTYTSHSLDTLPNEPFTSRYVLAVAWSAARVHFEGVFSITDVPDNVYKRVHIRSSSSIRWVEPRNKNVYSKRLANTFFSIAETEPMFPSMRLLTASKMVSIRYRRIQFRAKLKQIQSYGIKIWYSTRKRILHNGKLPWC